MQEIESSGPPAPILVRPPQAMKMLGISRTTLYELLKSGEIKSFSLNGKARLISVESLREWANCQIAEQRGVA